MKRASGGFDRRARQNKCKKFKFLSVTRLLTMTFDEKNDRLDPVWFTFACLTCKKHKKFHWWNIARFIVRWMMTGWAMNNEERRYLNFTGVSTNYANDGERLSRMWMRQFRSLAQFAYFSIHLSNERTFLSSFDWFSLSKKQMMLLCVWWEIIIIIVSWSSRDSEEFRRRKMSKFWHFAYISISIFNNTVDIFTISTKKTFHSIHFFFRKETLDLLR